jgi:chaperonin cofactor prefoldin
MSNKVVEVENIIKQLKKKKDKLTSISSEISKLHTSLQESMEELKKELEQTKKDIGKGLGAMSAGKTS